MKLIKSNIIRGTFILMVAGLLTRFLGFYYRIFLSSHIGAEGMGLYQMIFPIYSLCLSLSVSGVQLAISKFVSSNENNSIKTLMAGLFISVPISLICSLFLYFGGSFIADIYLNELRCLKLLKICSISLPMAVIHNCINGYFLGKKKAGIPAATQFIEQFARVATIWIIFYIYEPFISDNIVSLAAVAVIGLVVGEFMSMLVSIIATFLNKKGDAKYKMPSVTLSLTPIITPLFKMALPLTLTSLSLSLVHSLEASAIPFFLHKYGLTNSEAISVYGILTAMSMPFIMFPTIITSAVSRMLLPAISAALAEKNSKRISYLSMNTLKYSFGLGLFCTVFFLLTGRYIGIFFYDNELAGDFITILAWLCPFLFTASTLGSILNGLGLVKTTFYQHIVSSSVRLLFIIITIPNYGIKGYLWGILAGEVLCALLHTKSLLKYLSKGSCTRNHNT